jgi:hypothetical protein
VGAQNFRQVNTWNAGLQPAWNRRKRALPTSLPDKRFTTYLKGFQGFFMLYEFVILSTNKLMDLKFYFTRQIFKDLTFVDPEYIDLAVFDGCRFPAAYRYHNYVDKAASKVF